MSIENLTHRFAILRNTYLSTSLDAAIKYSILASLLIVSLFIRLLPLKFGAYINGFDSHLQYYATEVIVKGFETKGLTGLFDFFSFHIPLTWQPEGVNLAAHYFPGVPYIGAFVYIFLHDLLGINLSLRSVAIYFPVIFGVFGVYLVYLIGKESSGEFTGFIAALFYAISPSVVPRSTLGWYDTELGMPLLLLSIYLFIKSLKSSNKNEKAFFSILSGLAAGLLGATWGGFMYLYTLYAAYTILLILFFNIPEYYDLSYIPMIIITSIIVDNVPRIKNVYLFDTLAIIQYIAIGLVLTYKYIDYKSYYNSLWKISGVIFFLGLALAIFLPIFPSGISGRYLSVINPYYKEVSRFVQTVQEQASASYVYFYRGLFLLVPFSIYGFYVMTKEYHDTSKLFILLASITTIYTASNFVRLLILASPFIMILGAYGIQEILSIIFKKIYGEEKRYKKKFSEAEASLKMQIVIVAIVIILLGTYYTYDVGVKSATYPVTIVTGGAPTTTPSYDWFEALEWMKANIPDNESIAAWWDYGYWISFIGGKKSLADGGTMNATRISLLAEMFLSNEDHGIQIMKKLGAKYVLIYLGTIDISSQGHTFYILYGFGDEGKFIQMAKILGRNPDIYINRSNTRGSIYTKEFWNTFLGHLIPYEFIQKQQLGNQLIDIYQYYPKYPTQPNGHSKLILLYRTTDPGWGEVIIYKLVD